MRAQEIITERRRSWGIGDIVLMFNEPGPEDPPGKIYHLRQQQDDRGVTDQERDAILKQLPMIRRRMREFTRGEEFWLYDPKLNKAVGLKVLDYANRIYQVGTVWNGRPSRENAVIPVPGVDPQSLQEGWRDTIAGLAMGGLAATAGAHVVKPGDTVYSIARANNTTPAAVARANDLGADFNISVGQRLRIPGKDTQPAVKPAAKPTTQPAAKPTTQPAAKPAERPRQQGSTSDLPIRNAGPAEARVMRAAMKAGITKTSELAALLAQAAHETGNWSRMGENLSYSAAGLQETWPVIFRDPRIAQKYARNARATANRAYANRMGNGDERSGDGWRYRGRGYIQITGRDNYRRAGKALGLDLENNPDLALKPDNAARIAVWYWKNRVKPDVRDWYDVRRVTAQINPALKGLDDREQKFMDYYQLMRGQERRV